MEGNRLRLRLQREPVETDDGAVFATFTVTHLTERGGKWALAGGLTVSGDWLATSVLAGAKANDEPIEVTLTPVEKG